MSTEKCKHCDYWYRIGYGDAEEKTQIELAKLRAELKEAIRWKNEMDTQLVIHHLGTVESIPDPKKAHVMLQQWCYEHGKYEGQQEEDNG